MLGEGKRAAIFELRKQGHGIRRVARTLGASRNTVRRIIKSGTAQVPTILRRSKAEPYRAQILEVYSHCRGNLVQVHKELMALGAQFSYPALTNFARRNRLGDGQSKVTRSVTAEQQWLNEIIHGSRSLNILNREADDSSDIATLLYSLKNGRRIERKKAATILARKRGVPNATISKILHSARRTTRRYFEIYSEGGPSALFRSSTQQPRTQAEDPEKTRHILEFLHHKPTSFGINRTSWTQRALIQAYKERYKETISRGTITRLIKKAGYGWRRARRVLTSPDPNYVDKVEVLLRTMRSLTERELLFFLDEWGPVQVKKRGGRAYCAKDNIPRIPRHETPRGTVALVAALSATTNQMTWMFATSKDSSSMVGLLEILYNQHHAYSKLYITWDAVCWHNSTALMDWLDQFKIFVRDRGH